jgi:hypothetical protein
MDRYRTNDGYFSLQAIENKLVAGATTYYNKDLYNQERRGTN